MTRVRRLARKPIFLPEFVITLIRTPFLPPRYATFYVPLEFNKLDMREYMKRVYNVDILSIRSYVVQQKPTREYKDGRQGYGPLRRPKSKKKMTIEMTEPFVWPSVPEDKSPWQPDQFNSYREWAQDYQDAITPQAAAKPVKNEAEAYEKQAKEILEGQKSWKPTWQVLGLRYDRPALAKLNAGSPQESNEKKEEAKKTKKDESSGLADEISSLSLADSTPQKPKNP